MIGQKLFGLDLIHLIKIQPMAYLLQVDFKVWQNHFYFLKGILMALACMAFISCNQKTTGSSDVFHYNESSGIASLDPAFAKNLSVMWPVHQLYNTLVEMDTYNHVAPSLAKAWNVSDDRRSITFHLRTDVFFHDDPCFKDGRGRRMMARDIQYSLNRMIDPLTASPGAWVLNGKVRKNDPIVIINDSTVVLHLQEPFQPILGILTMKYCSIVPHEAVEQYGKDFGRHPVGTGPFRLLAWHENEAMVLTKNERYFETDSLGNRLPYLSGVKISFFDNKMTEFLEFRQQRIDFINEVDASFKDDILTKTGRLKKEWASTIQMNTCPYLNVEYLGMLTVKDSGNNLNILAERKIRQAVNYSINKPKMLMYLRNSIGTPAESGFIPPGLPSIGQNRLQGYRYDPVKAKQLLAEAGYGAGSALPMITLQTVPNYATLGTFIVNELRQSGIQAKVEVMQKSVLLDQMSRARVPFFRGSWIADYPDAENYLAVFYGKNPAPPNYTRYRNDVYDLMYEKAIREGNDSVKFSLYNQMDSMIISDAPVVPLWYDQVLHLVQKNVSGFSPNSLNMLELRRVKKQ